MISIKLDGFKKQLLEQLKKQGFVDANPCRDFIAQAEHARDYDNLAIGHIWLAEAFLHEENKIDCGRELEIAKRYINEKKPTEILEKYYFIEYKLYTSIYDTQTAFDYCLKSLNISEQLYENPKLYEEKRSCFINTVGNRIVGNYGNIGINFFNQGIYDKALLYCNKALIILKTQETVNVYAECLLRLNVIISLLRTDAGQDVLQYIHLLEKLSLEPKDLKIYVDYAYANFYLYKKEKQAASDYINALLSDEVEKYADRLTAIDFYMDILKPVIELKMKEQAEILFKEILRLIRENDEIRPLLNLVKLKILHAEAFNLKAEEQALYKEYFKLYLESEKLTNDLKLSGLEMRLKLNENETKNQKSKNQILILEDIANYDELTKIYNRRYLDIKYKELLGKKIKHLSLAIIDIDYFKEFNDSYGHLAGDDILKRIAKCLQDTLSEKMLVCRYGGDEFVVLSWEEAPNALYSYAQDIKKALEEMNIDHKKSHCAKQVTVSIGWTITSESIETQADIRTLFERADKALYTAKKNGRNQIAEV